MKNVYREWCETHEDLCVYMQSWFLDIVAPDWEVVLSKNKSEEIQGVWPYYLSKRRGFSLIQMPPYTQLLGPLVIVPAHIKGNYKRTSFYHKVVQEMEAKLPPFDHLNINFDSFQGTWFPLFTRSYKQSTRYTYLIDHNLPQEKLLENLKPQLRNTLKQKSKLGDIQKSEDVEGFIRFLENSFEEKRIGKFFHNDIIRSLVTKALERKQGCIYTFEAMEAAIFVIWDNQKTYLLFTAASEEGRANEGVAYLIWKAINESLVHKKSFDFEGSMLPNVEKYFRSFGGLQKAYHQISKTNSTLLKVYRFLKA